MAADLDKVYALIHKRDSGNAAACDRPSLAQCQFSYTRVVKELLGKPRVKAHAMPILVQMTTDPFDKKKYVDVCLLNTRYVKPPKGAQPWGGVRGKKMPKGKYNCNLNMYNRCFSLMGTPWSKLIDTSIVNEAKCSLEEALARLLWELTFDGWTEEKAKEKTAFIMDRIKEAEKEIKAGKCVTLPKGKKGKFNIVIPDIVTKQILDIAKGKSEKKKCGTCEGYGVWGIGDKTPMGRMDASDGLPTYPCPECGANANP